MLEGIVVIFRLSFGMLVLIVVPGQVGHVESIHQAYLHRCTASHLEDWVENLLQYGNLNHQTKMRNLN